jgi:hypothetical protein
MSLTGILLIALADYFFELPATARLTGLGLSLLASLAWLLWQIAQAIRQCKPLATAAEIESRFPELGQRMRTAVEFVPSGSFDRRSGAASSLIAALDNDTQQRTAPLNFNEAVPSRRLLGWLGAAALAAVALVISAGFGWEWRSALSRALGFNRPFTTLAVSPGETEVEQGQTLPVEFVVQGRARKGVRIQWRDLAQRQGDWTEEELDPAAASQIGERKWKFAALLPKVQDPVEYRVLAGPVVSPSFRVAVRYPLRLQKIAATIDAPAYTGIPAVTINDGNISGLAGSLATFVVTLDREPVSASAILNPLREAGSEPQANRTMNVEINGSQVRWSLPLEDDLTWTLVAHSKEGTQLSPRRYRVRIRHDQPPEVSFQGPRSDTEVHTLAEVLLRARAADDFGLTRSGIVFQINNLEEHTLLEEDFSRIAEAAEKAQQAGRLTPQTRGVLEKVLPLEFFSLSQKDAVMYYAFAEDNYPQGPHRTQSDLRFIDIRPFRLEYEEATGQPRGGQSGSAGGRLPTALDELIRRERHVLNRTMKLGGRISNRGDEATAIVDELVKDQGEIAALTRELADYSLEFATTQEVDTLYRAEASMLAAVDSLSVGHFETASVQEKDAQQYLVEGRNQLRILLAKNRSARELFRRANSRLLARLRREMNRDDFTRTLVQRLRSLSREEEQLSESARQLSIPDSMAAADENSSANQDSIAESIDEDKLDREKKPVSLAELEDRQYEALAEAQSILQRLQEIDDLTDLVKSRMQAVVVNVDSAAAGLGRGDLPTVAAQTELAADEFQELVRQIAGLTVGEFSQRVAATAQLAGELAEMERLAAEQIRSSLSADSASSAILTRATRRLQARAKTVADLMTDLETFEDPNAGNGPDLVAEISAQQKFAETLRRIDAATARASDANPIGAAELTVELDDTRERVEVMTGELDRLFRMLVMPRLARLRELESRLENSTQQMHLIQHGTEIGDWNRNFATIIRDLTQEQLNSQAREELLQLVVGDQLPGEREWSRSTDRNTWMPPQKFRDQLSVLGTDLRRQIQELILADFHSRGDGPVPPEYDKLVQIYLRVLSADSNSH